MHPNNGRFLRWVRADEAGKFFRHQAASTITTLVDFSAMILLVEVVLLSPEVAIGVSVALGGLTNFLLNRRWTFGTRQQNIWIQGLRYAAVSGGSLLWNMLGVHVLSTQNRLLPYVTARTLTAIVVSIVWNFPLHRFFVFYPSR